MNRSVATGADDTTRMAQAANAPSDLPNPFRSRSWWLSALLCFGMLCLLRGTNPPQEALWFFAKTDIIGLASILAEQNYPPETLFAQFIRTLHTFSFGLSTYFRLMKAGVSAETLFLATTYMQMAGMAVGVSLVAFSFRPSLSHMLLTCAVVFYGVFFYFGRYLNLFEAFRVSFSSGHALSLGLIVVGLLLNRFDRSAAVLAGTICLYHPSHGLVASALVGAVQLWRVFGAGREKLSIVAPVVVISAAIVIPILLFYKAMVPAFTGSIEEWWTMSVAIQRVMTPLADGWIIVIAMFIAGLLTVTLLSRPEFAAVDEARGRAQIIATVILLFLVIQTYSGEVIELTRLAQLVLTRSQPYMAMLSGAAVVAIGWIWWEGKRPGVRGAAADRTAAVHLVAAALIAELPLILPVIKLPIFVPPLLRVEWIYELMVLHHWRCILILCAALYWSLRRNSEARFAPLDLIYVGALAVYAILFGLRLEVLSVAALCLLANNVYPLPARLWKPTALTSAAVAVGALSLVGRPGWTDFPGRAESIQSIRDNVERGSMVLVVPHGASDMIQLLPWYSEFLNGYEMRYTLYGAWLTDLALENLQLQGIDPRPYLKECRAGDVQITQCLRIKYLADVNRRDDVWRRNLKTIVAKSPRLTHVLMLKSHSCRGDKVQAEIGQFFLVKIADVEAPGCS